MPPKTRTAKSTKSLKENIGISTRTRLKSTDKVSKPPRKVLGDKTNSASDDNASVDIPNKAVKKPSPEIKSTKILQPNDNVTRSRRERRIPSRFVDNQTLKSLSNNKENAPITSNINDDKIVKKNDVPPIVIINNDTISSVKNDCMQQSPLNTPQKVDELSLVANRPRRISRLPSRFEDHSISPSKFIPVQPCHASTPLAIKNGKSHNIEKIPDKCLNKSRNNDKKVSNVEQNKLSPVKKVVEKKNNNIPSDSNNNGRILRNRKATNVDEQPITLKNKTKGSPVKVNSTKSNKKVGKKAATPVKIKTSETKKSPVKPCSPIKHSYLNSYNRNSPFKVEVVKSPVKPSSPANKPTLRTLRKDLSFKILEENNKKESNQDVYEFTFDPTEEPATQKKKRKTVKRKPAKPKPKTVTFKYNYDTNVNKALAALKNAVMKKPTHEKREQNVTVAQSPNCVEASNNIPKSHAPADGTMNNTEVKTVPQVQRNVASKIIIGSTKQSSTNNVKNIPQIKQNVLLNDNKIQQNIPSSAAPMSEPNQSIRVDDIPANGNKLQQNVPCNVAPLPAPNHSIRVEDIAADFETSPQHDIDYSPVHSPARPQTPVAQISRISNMHHNDDPLNLRGNISFDPNPIASSSMNTSVRYPQPSPWRVEFESLPIRWHVNAYVKPNMTPAVETSFVNFDDKNKKKHVYTNLVPQHSDELPEVIQKEQTNLIQSSIISFIKEVVDKSSAKKNRGRSVTPVTASLFNDTGSKTPNKEDDKVKKSTRQLFTPKKNTDKRSDTSNPDSSRDASNDKENSNNSSRGHKRKNNEEPENATPAKTPRKEKDDKYFGFDDSENLENVSPEKEVGRKKSLRQAHARAVLREINKQPAPTRAVIPVAIKNARKAEVERLYDEMKSASDAPVLSAKEPLVSGAANEIQPIEEQDEDTQTSVHLFEDVEQCVHHLKPQRKSYGKAKKVTFVRQASSDTQDSDLMPQNESDDEEDLHDLTFDPGMPLLDEERKKPKKKQSKRQKMSKKEEEEAEAWAAGFNSMCEDVEEFALVVE